ncbi:hypothetical protein [Thalassotalea sp. ND16A]|uniref:hypothetical protein n=1 Tax=Thalassotalea sp. ND16A TaxID=1535422 RepID=UPI00051D030F|nr:hypothetical protein [Thalassotalea sp. ND16A]KGJ95796.1 hypothetical protein ND16A_1331 [Thalassotalea sp. ND16A]
MTIKKSLIAISLVCGLSVATSYNVAIAEETMKEAETISIEIPLLSDAQIFSKFDDKYPAMVNYFTKSTFDDVTVFYSNQFGSPVSEQTRYGRLELHFEHMQQNIRVIVAKQKHHREVDVIVEQMTAEEY